MTSFGSRSTAEQVSQGVDLSGRHAIVTGANTGIGWETARVLALRGATVTLACRDLARAEAARARMLDRLGDRVGADALEVRELDLAALDSVRAFSAGFVASGRPLHLLINNAGIMIPDRRETREGFEAHFGINHLGHFLLTCLLLDMMHASAPARVVQVSSSALHFNSLTRELVDLDWKQRKYSGWRAYGDSKLMNVVFAREVTRRFGDRGIVANALHPGIVRTELARDQSWPMKIFGIFALPVMKGPARGAATSVYAATAPAFENDGGHFLADCADARCHPLADDPELASRLWARSEALSGLGA